MAQTFRSCPCTETRLRTRGRGPWAVVLHQTPRPPQQEFPSGMGTAMKLQPRHPRPAVSTRMVLRVLAFRITPNPTRCSTWCLGGSRANCNAAGCAKRRVFEVRAPHTVYMGTTTRRRTGRKAWRQWRRERSTNDLRSTFTCAAQRQTRRHTSLRHGCADPQRCAAAGCTWNSAQSGTVRRS